MSREENSTGPIKCLSLRGAWGGLIVWGGKDTENRSWRTHHRGRIAIHQSAKWDATEVMNGKMLYERILGHPADPVLWQKIMESTGIIGTVEIVDCVTSSISPWFFGPYGFVLKDPRPLVKPIPKLGKLGLWDLDPETERLVVEGGG